MAQIQLENGLHRETVIAKMMLFKNMKAMVSSPDGDTDFFDIIIGDLRGDTFALYLLILCLDYVFQTSIDLINENGFTIKKKGADRRYLAETMADAD